MNWDFEILRVDCIVFERSHRQQILYREYHVCVFDIKFIRREQKQHRNGEVC